MTLSTPCDACGTPLRRDVVTLRFMTSTISYGTTSQTRVVPDLKQEYLVCPGCASYVQACVAVLEGRVGAEPYSVREMAS